MTSGVRWGERGIDTFQPLELIGEGTYGTVWKALDLLTMETVALKMIRVVDDNEGVRFCAPFGNLIVTTANSTTPFRSQLLHYEK